MIGILVVAREKAELTERQLAVRLRRPPTGAPHPFVGRMGAGERRVDGVEFIEIARILGTNPREMFKQLL